MLLKFKFIKKIKIGNYTVFMPVNFESDMGIIIFIMQDDINKKILLLLKDQGLIKKSDVYKEINEKRENVYYRINNLIENDVINTKEKENLIFINPKKIDIISIILHNKNYIENN